MKRRNAYRALAMAGLAVSGLDYSALGGITYLNGTAFYTFTPVFGSATGQTTSSDPSLPASSSLTTAAFEINGNASPLGGAGGQAGSSSTGAATAGYIANSTTASIALKGGTGVTQTDPAGGTSYAFSQTRLDFKDATALKWDATSPGFGPTMTLFGSYTVAGSIGAGGFARCFVNLAFYRNSISGANALGSVVLDTGTMSTAGAFNRTLTASIPASLSSLTTGTDLLMIGTIQFQADNHAAPTEISFTDFSTGNSYSGQVSTYVGNPAGGGWFAQGSWQSDNNEITSAPDAVGERAYIPNDQGVDRTFNLGSPVTLGVLDISGSASNTINGGPLTLNNINDAPSMVFLKGDYGAANLTLNALIQAADTNTEFLNESKAPMILNGGIATNAAGATIIKSGGGSLTINGAIDHTLSNGATYEIREGEAFINSDIGGNGINAFASKVDVGSAGQLAQLSLGSTQQINQLTIGAHGKVRLDLPGKAAIGVEVLDISTTGLSARGLDVRDDGLALRTTNATPLSFIGDLLALGYANGDWNGKGINSGTAAADSMHSTAVGYGRVSAVGSITSFLGQTVDSNDIVLRYTLYGDADLNAVVNLNDFTRLAAGFGGSGSWTGGDFNFDGTVNLDDFTQLASNFGRTLPAGLPRGMPVPEPAGLLVGTLICCNALFRRRRSNPI